MPHAVQIPTDQASVVALNAVAMPAEAEALPEWLLLVAAGRMVGRDGREFVAGSAAVIVNRFKAKRLPIVVDYEHGSEIEAPAGRAAPAAGWIDQLEARDDGSVWGRVEWNSRARDMLVEREYRFYSPALEVDDKVKPPRVIGVKSVGLTNQPNLGVPALNHQQPENTAMLDETIRQALGLKDEATADDAVVAINAMKDAHQVALNRAQMPSLDKFVPRGDYDVALNRAETAEAELAKERNAQAGAAIDAAIDAALEAKKITPSTVEYHRAQCATEGGLERFKAFVEQAPEIVGDSGLANRQPGASTQLNAEQAHVAKLLNKPTEIFVQHAQ